MSGNSNKEVKDLLTLIFREIELAKECESNRLISESINHYLQAINLLTRVTNLEKDTRKLGLLNEQIQTLRADLNRLQGVSRVPTISSSSTSSSSQNQTVESIIRQADEMFVSALDLDEKNRTGSTPESVQQCIDSYIAAAQGYMKLPKDAANAKKKRVVQILDRVEALKISLNPSSVTSSSDLSDVLPEAPSFATGTVKAAAAGGAAINLDDSLKGNTQPKWAGAAKKSSIENDLPTAAALASGGAGGLSQLEIQVLRLSSVVNGRVFQPWLPGEEERERFRFDHPFCDPDGLLPLSSKQIAAGAEWRRPREFILGEDVKPTMIELISPLSITQDLVSDCSFVCSLCIASAFEARFRKKLITSIIYPQNASKKPIYNAYGKYLVKLFINGVERKVVVDDRLPVTASTGQLLCSSSTDPKELWVSIIEKAYMKVNGGYDFPGSNSGIDLYALTGWIPERVYFAEDAALSVKRAVIELNVQDHRQGEDRAWERIKSAHGFGDCLVTISTSALTTEEESYTGLVPGHAYAVLDVKEAGNLRMMRVKNPWARRPWKGRFSSVDRGSWTEGLKTALGVSDGDFDKMEKHGLFWIEFEDCRKYFKSFNLSWNPSLFSYRTCVHDFWPATQGPKNDRYFIGDNPQFTIIVDKKRSPATSASSPSSSSSSSSYEPTSSTIWLLLSRHVTQKESKETVSGVESRDSRDGDFLALHVFRVKRMRRIYSHSIASIKGLYTNDPHQLVRIDVDNVPMASCETETTGAGTGEQGADDSESTFALVVSQIDKCRDVCYTLNVYSTAPFRFYPTPKPPPHKLELPGSWTELTCGGPPSSRFFYRNPQYRILVGGSAPVQVHIQILFKKEISACLDLCHGGNRLDSIPEGQSVSTSGAYRAGYCDVESTLSPGTYTLILSTFTREMVGPYMLTIQSSHSSIGAAEIGPEGLPGFKTAIRGDWNAATGTAAGCSNFGNYHKNPVYTFTLPHPSRCSIRLGPVSDHSYVSLNVSLYHISAPGNEFLAPPEEQARGLLSTRANPKRATFTSNGAVYSGKPTGVTIDNVELPAGLWALVPSTFEPTAEQFDLFISFSLTSSITVNRNQ